MNILTFELYISYKNCVYIYVLATIPTKKEHKQRISTLEKRNT